MKAGAESCLGLMRPICGPPFRVRLGPTTVGDIASRDRASATAMIGRTSGVTSLGAPGLGKTMLAAHGVASS